MTHPYDPPIQSLTTYLYNHTISNPTAYASARIALLDALGCAIETASKSTEAQKLLGPRVPGTIVPHGFRVPGTEYQLDPVKGAFDLGVLVRYLDHNDALWGREWGHPSAYEIQGIYAQSNAFNTHGTDHVILVKLASAAVVSWLLGLTESQTMATISHVWMDGHPSRIYRGAEDTIPRKGWAAGDACMRAVYLALLVRAGQVGVPSVLSAVPWGFYQRDFGGKGFEFIREFGDWMVRNVLYKVMPVEGHGIAAVEAVLVQRRRLLEMGFGVRDVERIEIRTTRAADLIINKRGPLRNAADRDHCMQFVVALALLKGGVPEVADYQDESCWVKSQELESLRERVVVVPDDRLTADYLDLEKKSIGSGLKVCLCDGTVLPEVLVEYPIGHVRNPKTSAAVRDKFVRNMRLVFSDAHIARILAAVEDDEMGISEFVNLFWLQGSSGPRL
ncbi:unnamed protein product [Aspergillus oryzae var. brunneus]|uniref:Unnamed protein product n=2 Tax=Aspergillus oryzae TaxID=5062 RepID=A0AAN5C001_ASPOZ|nr:unnamed protein product [Aspergillus oryzae]GMG04109.1 unnamed protein product [Aspergillus oryzae]GMG33558.1 unnamed protein product [Aspergillus oryzae]GMG48510.1 unnamed protein product [Aspergillus oryzae var. brunneus]